jgi:hypothetical protein
VNGKDIYAKLNQRDFPIPAAFTILNNDTVEISEIRILRNCDFYPVNIVAIKV